MLYNAYTCRLSLSDFAGDQVLDTTFAPGQPTCFRKSSVLDVEPEVSPGVEATLLDISEQGSINTCRLWYSMLREATKTNTRHKKEEPNPAALYLAYLNI